MADFPSPSTLPDNSDWPVTVFMLLANSMHYHVCKFSVAVKRSYFVPAPRSDPTGFIASVKHAVQDAKIDLIIPLHEEIFYLAKAAGSDPELCGKLFAPPFNVLIKLHSKWNFSRFLKSVGLDAPEAHLCKDYQDVKRLDSQKEWALKPVFGRGATKVFHLQPGKPTPRCREDELDVGDEKYYIAQEWMKGQRYCSYAVVRHGAITAFAVYPVQDTIDGSSCVYFQATDQPNVRLYVEHIAKALPNTSGQLAFDFIETGDRLVAIECNPRATSGIHLYSGTPDLAHALTNYTVTGHYPPAFAAARPGARRQLAPGMLMWRRTREDHDCKGAIKEYVRHMARLTTSKDVIFSKKDLLPSLMQPFLLTSYYAICREKNLKLPEMFQWDMIWDPKGDELALVRAMLDRDEQDEHGTGSEDSGFAESGMADKT